MLWKNRKVNFILAFLLALFFVSVSSSSSTYATSQSFHFEKNVNNFSQQVFDSSTLGFTPVAVYVEFYTSESISQLPIFNIYTRSNSYSGFSCFLDSNGWCKLLLVLPNGGLKNYSNSSFVDYIADYTFYDSVPDFDCDCPTPEPCSEVPENPYDDKLDKLTKAIYYVPAVIIVIYFFYVMFSWYNGGRS